MDKFAVVRMDRQYADYKFTIWHDTFEEAKQEAERLCKKHKVQFSVIQEVASCLIQDPPVTWLHR